MDNIVIEGVRPYDGTWPFDLENEELTTREWGWIKRLAGYLPLTIEEGLSDPELIVVFAVVALHRAGQISAREAPQVFEDLADAPFGAAVRLETEPVETEGDDAGPPEPKPTSSGGSSGEGSRTSSETSEPPPNGSGMPDSDMSASVPVTLVT